MKVFHSAVILPNVILPSVILRNVRAARHDTNDGYFKRKRETIGDGAILQIEYHIYIEFSYLIFPYNLVQFSKHVLAMEQK
jgi:hypothetical protein